MRFWKLYPQRGEAYYIFTEEEYTKLNGKYALQEFYLELTEDDELNTVLAWLNKEIITYQKYENNKANYEIDMFLESVPYPYSMLTTKLRFYRYIGRMILNWQERKYD